MNFKLTIAWLYPDLMSTYGDRGNIICLTKRCQWRGIDVEIVPITLETQNSKLRTCDLIFMGGAQDRQQKLVGEDFLKRKGPVVKKMVEAGIPALFVCAAYQFVGHYYKPYEGDKIPGAGIFDLYTKHPGDQEKRLIGNVVAKLASEWVTKLMSDEENKNSLTHHPFTRSLITIVGFENHGGRTFLGPKMQPLAKIMKGFGNNGEDGYEGAVYKNAIGSYFHGPLLPKNPHVADWLIRKALEVKYKKDYELAQLDDSLEWQAHNQMV